MNKWSRPRESDHLHIIDISSIEHVFRTYILNWMRTEFKNGRSKQADGENEEWKCLDDDTCIVYILVDCIYEIDIIVCLHFECCAFSNDRNAKSIK